MPIEADLGRQEVIGQLLHWSHDRGFEARGLEEQLLVLERILQDLDDDELTRLFYSRLTWWFVVLQRTLGPETIASLRGLQLRLQYIVELLADTSYPQQRLSTIQPVPPADFRSENDQESESADRTFWNAQRVLAWANLPDSAPGVADWEMTLLRGALARRGSALEAIEEGLPESDSRFRNSSDLLLQPSDLFSPGAVGYVWWVDVHFEGSGERRLGDIAESLHAIAAALESVDGVTVFISKLSSGSIWARLKVVMRDAAARDDVKSILVKARDGLVAKEFDSAIASTDRDRSEANKLKEEAETLRAARESVHRGDEAERIRQLEIERLELENQEKRVEVERKQIENALLKLQLVEHASALLAKGLLKSMPVTVGINERLFVALEKGQAPEIAPMDAIVENEERFVQPDAEETKA